MRPLFLNPSGFGNSHALSGGWMPARLARLAGTIPGAKLVDARVEGCTAQEMVLLARGFDRIFVDSGWRPADAVRVARALRQAEPRVRIAAVVHQDQSEPHGFEWDARIPYGDADAACAFAGAVEKETHDEISVYARDLRIERYRLPILAWPYLALDGSDRSVDEIASLANAAKYHFPKVRDLYLVGSPLSGDSKRADLLANALAPIGMRWSCAMEPSLESSALAALAESGLRTIRARMHGTVDMDRSRRFSEDCRRLGISVQGLFMLGKDGETSDSIDNTLRYALSTALDAIQINLAPKSESLSLEELQTGSRRIVRRFYLRPKTLSRQILRTLREADNRGAAMRETRALLRSIWDGRAGTPS